MVHRVEFGVVLYGEYFQVASLPEAENRMKRHEPSDLQPSYIVRRGYSKNGQLIEEVMVG
jgi:hypothetical protein